MRDLFTIVRAQPIQGWEGLYDLHYFYSFQSAREFARAGDDLRETSPGLWRVAQKR